MKKLVVLLLAISFVWSCNSNEHSGNKELVNLNDTTKLRSETNTEELTLNNNAKWKADAKTGNNVINLQKIIDKFNKDNDNTLPGYQKAAVELQGGLDKMISECRMEGPDHEALHKWIHPLLKQVNAFKQSSTTAGAGKILMKINEQVNKYYLYFE